MRVGEIRGPRWNLTGAPRGFLIFAEQAGTLGAFDPTKEPERGVKIPGEGLGESLPARPGPPYLVHRPPGFCRPSSDGPTRSLVLEKEAAIAGSAGTSFREAVLLRRRRSMRRCRARQQRRTGAKRELRSG